MELFRILSLRGRFLVAPAIGILLTSILYLTTNRVISTQSDVFQQLSESNLSQISQISRFSILLSDNLVDLTDLLSTPAEELDEETVYLEGREILNDIHDLRRSLLEDVLVNGSIVIEGVDLTQTLNEAMEAYLEGAIKAIELTTVDKNRAQTEYRLTSAVLNDIQELLVGISDYYVGNLSDASLLIEETSTGLLPINLIALVLILSMIIVAFYFAQHLSRGLESVNNTLLRLARGENQTEIPEYNDQYLQSLANAARQFKNTLQENKQQHEELEQSLEQIRSSEERISELLELAATAIIAIDPQQNIILFNRVAEEMFGYDSEEVIGKSVTLLMPEQFRQGHVKHVARFSGGTDNAITSMSREPVIGLRKNGEQIYVEASISRLETQGKTLMTASLTDITERLQAEGELSQLRNYLENIINSMPSVLIGVDQEGTITQWNHQAAEETQISAKNAIGRSLLEVYPHYAQEMDRIRLAIESRKEQSDFGVERLKDGEIIYEDVSIFPLIANGVQGAVVRIDNVTQQMRLKEMMIQSEKMASVGGLAAGMAHEINNPLGGMIQTAAVLRDRLGGDLKSNQKAAEEVGISLQQLNQYAELRGIDRMLNTIQESGSRAAEIVSNMLGFTRKAESSTSSCDLNELVDYSLQLAETDYDMKKSFDFRRVTIKRLFNDEIPPVPCNSQKLQQVILNLLKNAAQAMFAADVESPTIAITAGIDHNRSQVYLSFSDNGPGIEEPDRRRVFEPFFTTKPVGVGTGLGLSVSYFIITENHHGDLTVESKPGAGATFTIYLPAQLDPEHVN